ncbi:hypothetical protein B4Z39_002003 [Escherichia coli]|nr:hypothetical protein [Escherichia coli]EGO9603872.1 hypothetical protein [Escherichia coli]
MTCGFEDKSIDTGRFVLSRINSENYQFHHIRFDCIQGEQGELVFEPSEGEYYFEPVTIQESGTSILKNELENSEDGAGQIGFHSPMMVRMKSSMVKAITTLFSIPMKEVIKFLYLFTRVHMETMSQAGK